MSDHIFSAALGDTATIEAQEREAARHQQWIDRALAAESTLAALEADDWPNRALYEQSMRHKAERSLDEATTKLARLQAIALDIASYPPARRGANHRQAYVSWNLIEKLRAALLGKRP